MGESNSTTQPARAGEQDGLTRLVTRLLASGGPRPADYPRLDREIRRVYDSMASRRDIRDRTSEIRRVFGDALSPETVIGLSLAKPRGYAGDFEMIERLYSRWESAVPDLASWDRYIHEQAAPKAVRNRSRYFCSVLESVLGRQGSARVLEIGCGPGRTVHQWFETHPEADVTFECVDVDLEAIEFAKSVNSKYASRIEFHNRNVFRFKSNNQFDVIWSSGLFDYFDDRVFEKVAKRLIGMLAPGGELIVGNFAVTNPSRPHMELLCDWYLHHRTVQQLVDLVVRAGSHPDNVRVGVEGEGVNLFVHCRR